MESHRPATEDPFPIGSPSLKGFPDPAKLNVESIPRLEVTCDLDNLSLHSDPDTTVTSNSEHETDVPLDIETFINGHSHHRHDIFTKVTGLIARKISSNSLNSNSLHESPTNSRKASHANSPFSSTESLQHLISKAHLSGHSQHHPSSLAESPSLMKSSRSLSNNLVSPNPTVKETHHVYLEYDPVSKRKVLNTYEILREVGRGQHGKVKLAKDLLTKELVAIKIVDRKQRPRLKLNAGGSSQEDKIRKEIAIMKKCNHPHVVKLREVLDDSKSRKIYMVLEYLEKGEVKWQKEKGVPALSFKDARSIFRDVVLGLEYLHFQGIVHRDIKPANLLLSKDNIVKISDFGVSFANLDDKNNELDLAKTAGTPAFYAPELCQFNFDADDSHKKPNITHKIDIWALGVTLYCLLFGKVPFDADSEFGLFDVIVNEQLQFPSKESLPNGKLISDAEFHAAKHLLNNLLNKDPEKRIDIPEIKKDEFALMDLVGEDIECFAGINCLLARDKINVSNEDMNVAVLGVGNKLKRSLVKALKFTGIHPHTTPSSPASPFVHPDNGESKTKDSSSSSSSSSNVFNHVSKDPFVHSFILSEATGTPPMSPDSRPTTPHTYTNSLRRGSSLDKRSMSNSEAGLIETKKHVIGDLYIQNQSAVDTFKDIIIQNEKRRSSFGTNISNYNSERSPSVARSAQPSFLSQPPTISSTIDGDSPTIVPLPINDSFASLDSFKEDYYAFKQSQANEGKGLTSTFKNYDLGSNMKAEPVAINDEAIPPGEKPINALTPLHKRSVSSYVSYSSSESSEESEDSEEEAELTLAFGPKRDLPKAPPLLRKRVMSHESKLNRHFDYGHMNESLEIPLSLQGDLAEFVDVPMGLMNGSSASTATITPHYKDLPERPATDMKYPISDNINSGDHQEEGAPPVSLFLKKNGEERVPSPLSQNAPKSWKASINSHLLNTRLTPEQKHQFINHYKKDPINSPFPHALHLDNAGQSRYRRGPQEEGKNMQHRSNSITVGIIQFENGKARANTSAGAV